MHHVILGAGPAGVTAAETLRKHAPDAQITLVAGEPEPPYSRMAIPYLLEGKIQEQGAHLRQTDGHYDAKGIVYKQGPVTKLDASAKTLTCADGSSLNYDKLLIATGATPIRPPIAGLDSPGVHTCWTLADARQILQHAKPGQPVVLVGAGFIGCIILESLAKMGVELTVVEMGDRMVPRMLDETAGTMLKRWCEKKGVKVLTNAAVESISPGGGGGAPAQAAAPAPKPAAAPAPSNEPGFLSRLFGAKAPAEAAPEPEPAPTPAPAPAPAAASGAPLTVKLKDGQALPAALVVVAAGVKSNIGFLEGSGVATDRGVRVDQFLATSVPDVYAAGDVAEGVDLSTGEMDMLAIQPVAVEHGYLAALNMAGTPTKHRGSLNMNVLDTLGLISSSFGLWQGASGGTRAQMVDEDGFRYMRLEFDGDRLVGAQCVGMTEHVGMLRGMIQTSLRLGHWKDKLMAAPQRIPEAYVNVMQKAPKVGPTAPHPNLPA